MSTAVTNVTIDSSMVPDQIVIGANGTSYPLNHPSLSNYVESVSSYNTNGISFIRPPGSYIDSGNILTSTQYVPAININYNNNDLIQLTVVRSDNKLSFYGKKQYTDLFHLGSIELNKIEGLENLLDKDHVSLLELTMELESVKKINSELKEKTLTKTLDFEKNFNELQNLIGTLKLTIESQTKIFTIFSKEKAYFEEQYLALKQENEKLKQEISDLKNLNIDI